MTNRLRSWLHEHLDAPLDGVFLRLEGLGVDDDAPGPWRLAAAGLPMGVLQRPGAPVRGARRVAH